MYGDCCSDLASICEAGSDELQALSDFLTVTNVQMPEVALEYAASEYRIETEIRTLATRPTDLSDAEPFARAVQTIVEATAADIAGNSGFGGSGLFSLLEIADGGVTFESNAGLASLRTRLNDRAAAEGAPLFDALVGTQAHFRVHDIGADIVGEDLVLFQPDGELRMLVVRSIFAAP